jgi:hypothetical protein
MLFHMICGGHVKHVFPPYFLGAPNMQMDFEDLEIGKSLLQTSF